MKTLIFILIITSFIQTTILPLDLVLIILICRSYISFGKASLYLAFAFGFLVSFLNVMPLGLQSIIYLTIIQLTQVLARSRLAGNSLLVIPITLFFLSLNQLVNSAPLFPTAIIGSILSLPIFYLVKLWEERFIVTKEIKLRV